MIAAIVAVLAAGCLIGIVEDVLNAYEMRPVTDTRPAAQSAEMCGCYPHGPDEPCTCNGCHYCTGHKHGCTCDINWSCTSYDPCPERARNQRLIDLADEIHDHVADIEQDPA